VAKKLKAGVIGVGILGGQHADFYHNNPDVELVGLADARKEAAEAKAAETGARAYGSAEEMIRQERPDVVSIATPDPLHKEPFLAAVEGGVPNIVTEKPLATTAEDGEVMMEAAETRGAKVFINFSNRGLGPDRAIRYLYQKGLIGELIYGQVQIDDNIVVPTTMWGGRSQEWAGGSSTAHFLMSHGVDILRFYFAPAEVASVYATAQKRVLGYTPDLYDALLTFDNGAKVRMKAEWTRRMDELVEWTNQFTGTEGSVDYHKFPSFATKRGLRINVSDQTGPGEMLEHQEAIAALGAKANVLLHRPAPVLGRLVAGEAKLERAFEIWELDFAALDNILGAFVRSIIEDTLEPSNYQGSGSVPTGRDGLIQTKVVTAIIESSETGQEVVL
jgi:predicted dehydrogenase